MWPVLQSAGSFRHPKSIISAVGKIRARSDSRTTPPQKLTVQEAERWLAPILNYDPKALSRLWRATPRPEIRPRKNKTPEGWPSGVLILAV